VIKSELVKILSAIQITFESTKFDITPEKVELWYECLNDLDYTETKAVITKLAQTNKYPPSIAEIRQAAKPMIKISGYFEERHYSIEQIRTLEKQLLECNQTIAND